MRKKRCLSKRRMAMVMAGALVFGNMSANIFAEETATEQVVEEDAAAAEAAAAEEAARLAAEQAAAEEAARLAAEQAAAEEAARLAAEQAAAEEAARLAAEQAAAEEAARLAAEQAAAEAAAAAAEEAARAAAEAEAKAAEEAAQAAAEAEAKAAEEAAKAAAEAEAKAAEEAAKAAAEAEAKAAEEAAQAAAEAEAKAAEEAAQAAAEAEAKAAEEAAKAAAEEQAEKEYKVSFTVADWEHVKIYVPDPDADPNAAPEDQFKELFAGAKEEEKAEKKFSYISEWENFYYYIVPEEGYEVETVKVIHTDEDGNRNEADAAKTGEDHEYFLSGLEDDNVTIDVSLTELPVEEETTAQEQTEAAEPETEAAAPEETGTAEPAEEQIEEQTEEALEEETEEALEEETEEVLEEETEEALEEETEEVLEEETEEALEEETEDLEEETEEEAVIEQLVSFKMDEGVSVLVDGRPIENSQAFAQNGKIVFTVLAKEGVNITSVLVDDTIEARTTENEDEYIIEGIQTDATIVTITAEAEEIPMPEQIIGPLVLDDGTEVTFLVPEGALPEGTTAEVITLEAEDLMDEIRSRADNADLSEDCVAAYSFVFYTEEEEKIEPQKAITVQVDNPETETAQDVYYLD